MLTTLNIDIQAMLVWLTLPFYDFCGLRSVAVNSVYKLQFFYIYHQKNRLTAADVTIKDEPSRFPFCCKLYTMFIA